MRKFRNPSTKLVQEGIMFDPRKVGFGAGGGAARNGASTWTRLATIALAVGTIAALAAPAWGQGDDLTLRRDGSKAVPLVADVSVKGDANAPNVPALRRDGSEAEPFVAQVGTASKQPVDSSAAPTTSGVSSGFDWGDAAIGAGLGAVAALLAVGAVGAVRRRSATRAASAPAAR
jgi:hypothetical protein